MQPFNWGRRSCKVLSELHPDWQKILEHFRHESSVEIGLHEGHRSIARQRLLYSLGKSTIDGVTKTSKHNLFPSLAFDCHIYTSQKKYADKVRWDNLHFAYVYGVLDAIAKDLYSKGQISHLIRWGNDWDKDGILMLDHTFHDGNHFELVKP